MISFDNDTNNGGVADEDCDGARAVLEFRLQLTSFPGKNDFYSVALHEMIHALGLRPRTRGTELVWERPGWEKMPSRLQVVGQIWFL